MCDVDGTIDKNSKSDAAVINEIEEYQMYAYLELKRKIYCLRDFDYDLLTLGIDLECWDSLQVRLRPIKNNARKSNIFGTISPVSLDICCQFLLLLLFFLKNYLVLQMATVNKVTFSESGSEKL